MVHTKATSSRTQSIAKMLGVAALCSVIAFGVAGCASIGKGLTGGVAATVNGHEIPEDKVTTFIQDTREKNKLNTEDAWGKWLAQSNLTPEAIRSQVIDKFIADEVVRLAVQDQGIELDKKKANEVIDSMKAQYKNEDNWKKALQDAGLTEDSYRESVELQLLRQTLGEKVYQPQEIDVNELNQMATQFGSNFDGAKRSSHILIKNDKAKAEDLLNKINKGEISFEDAAKQYSEDPGSKDKGGDVGWDKMNSFVPAYTQALADLNKGQVSGLVQSDYGFHIIKVTDVYTGPKEVTQASQLPQDVQEMFKTAIQNQKRDEFMENWMKDFRGKLDIKINEIPKNVPYNVKDMEKYKKEVEEAARQAQEQAQAAAQGQAPQAPQQNPQGESK